MSELHRFPLAEEGRHNIVLQNRCGNRLTLLSHDYRTDLELTYKPNALRRKDLAARDFSNREISTAVFASATLPEIDAGLIQRIDYDPFVTRFEIESPAGARNNVTILNLANHNAFVFAADRPLSVTLRPHEAFDERDGELTEVFDDRGEDIVSFALFPGRERSKYRSLRDGRIALQLRDNDLLVLGAEESLVHVEALARHLRGQTLKSLLLENERALATDLHQATLTVADSEFQRVADLGKRIAFSGIDAGGAAYAKLQRRGHILRSKEAALTACALAQCGLPQPLGSTAAFLLANPARLARESGDRYLHYGVTPGESAINMNEDSLSAVALALHCRFELLGDARFIATPDFENFLDAIDHTIKAKFSEIEELFSSDTLGSQPLVSSSVFGYNQVTGAMPETVGTPDDSDDRKYSRVFTLSQNLALYNTLLIAARLLSHSHHDSAKERSTRYRELADRLASSLTSKFITSDGIYYSFLAFFDDGSRGWVKFEDGDQETYCQALTLNPYLPDLASAIKSVRHIFNNWPESIECTNATWSALLSFLREYGELDTTAFKDTMRSQVREALTKSESYPLVGAIPEIAKQVESARPLPHASAQFLHAISSLLLRPLAQGLAVRASGLVDSVEAYHYRNSIIDVDVLGTGETVRSWELNGQSCSASLQLPENLLRHGRNRLLINRANRGVVEKVFRLHSSNATLLRVEQSATEVRFIFQATAPVRLIVESADQAESLRCTTLAETEIPFERSILPESGHTLVQLEPPKTGEGEFILAAQVSHLLPAAG